MIKMTLSLEGIEVLKYNKLVCELEQRSIVKNIDNINGRLSKELININGKFINAGHNTNEACQYLNECAGEIIRERTWSSSILVGKKSVPLIVSIKKLADSIFNSDIMGCDIKIEEKLQNSLSKDEDNLHGLDDLRRRTSNSIQNVEFLVKSLLKQHPQERNLSTVSEISSFLDKDVVTSSPIKMAHADNF